MPLAGARKITVMTAATVVTKEIFHRFRPGHSGPLVYPKEVTFSIMDVGILGKTRAEVLMTN